MAHEHKTTPSEMKFVTEYEDGSGVDVEITATGEGVSFKRFGDEVLAPLKRFSWLQGCVNKIDSEWF